MALQELSFESWITANINNAFNWSSELSVAYWTSYRCYLAGGHTFGYPFTMIATK
jgi:hypothetical protein